MSNTETCDETGYHQSFLIVQNGYPWMNCKEAKDLKITRYEQKTQAVIQ